MPFIKSNLISPKPSIVKQARNSNSPAGRGLRQAAVVRQEGNELYSWAVGPGLDFKKLFYVFRLPFISINPHIGLCVPLTPCPLYCKFSFAQEANSDSRPRCERFFHPVVFCTVIIKLRFNFKLGQHIFTRLIHCRHPPKLWVINGSDLDQSCSLQARQGFQYLVLNNFQRAKVNQ